MIINGNKIMYNISGELISVVEKTKTGYIGIPVYEYMGQPATNESSDDSEPFVIDEEYTRFYKELYPEPVTTKYSQRIHELKAKIKQQEAKLMQLFKKENESKQVLSKVSEYPIVNQLVKFLTKDYNFVVNLKKDVIVNKKDFFFYTTNWRVKCSGGIAQLIYQSGEYESSDYDYPIYVCDTEQEAIDYLKEKQFLYRINNFNTNYNRVGNLSVIWERVIKAEMNTDKELLEAYRKKMTEMMALDEKDKLENLLKKENDLRTQLAELDELKKKGGKK